MKINDVIVEIHKGTFDDQMRMLNDVIKSRKELVAERMLYSLRPDDQVRLNGLRPKSLNGLVGKVIKTNRTTVTVRLGEDAGRHQGVNRIPCACCEKVTVDG